MEKGLYKETVEYDIIDINENWNYYFLAFQPGAVEETIPLFDKYNPSFYLSVLIYNVWDKFTNTGRHDFINNSNKELSQTCIALLYERKTDDIESNLVLGKNGKFYKYRNSIAGMYGDLEFLYSQFRNRVYRDDKGSLNFAPIDYLTNSDGTETGIEICWL